MSIQETALHGDLVLALRDYAAGLLSANSTLDVEAARTELDEFVRTWFFTPQRELYGSAPREVIWREQLGEPNPIPREYAAEAYGDDCPICQMMREEIESAESDEAHGHFWTYCPDSCLLDHYDPEGSDERWSKEFAQFDAEPATMMSSSFAPLPEPEYVPPPMSDAQLDPSTFLSVLRWPGLDPELHKAAQQLAERCDVPQSRRPWGSSYRRVTQDEALCLLAGLHQQRVDIGALLVQIEAWPYENVALDWLSEPERCSALVEQALETELDPKDETTQLRFRNHRDFILSLARVMPPSARLWLSGWLEAVSYGAMLPGH